jgi:putative pyruvate formate lyase activating enzyme
MSLLQKIDARELKQRADEAYSMLSPCQVCPRDCRLDRLKGKRGFCKAGLLPEVSSYHAHFGEEPPISGRFGSGTIFFTHCSLRCVFCQNYPISQLGEGREVSLEELADMMLELQAMGCHNINFVTPTHYTPQILSSLLIAKEKGLRIPLVYNCGGYESVRMLKLFEGIIDIYMPDFKYGDNRQAKRYSFCDDYVQTAIAALKEMHRQVGELRLKEGVALRGLLVRHLVLPQGLAGSARVFDIIAKEISPQTAVNVMAQYYPTHNAGVFKEINRMITAKEYNLALRQAKEAGLGWGWKQNVSILFRDRIPEWRDNLKDGSD